MDKYFLVYPLTDDWQQVSWCAYAPDEELQVKQGSLDTLAKIAPNVPMIAVLPGTWLNIFSITLPKGRASQIKKAIPFLLEEQLAEDLENIHIALPAVYQLGEITPVAVISKNRMQVLKDAFKNQNLNLQQAVPNWLCLPLFEQTWTLHLTQELACVRQAKDLGFCIQKSLLMPMLTLALSQAEQKPQSLHVYHLALEAADMEEQLTTLKIPLAYEAVSDESLLLWTENFTSPAALNLLQGEFFVKPKVSAVKQIWRKSAAVFVAIIVAFVLQSSIEFQHYQKQYDAVHAKTLALYTSVFPNETQTTNARAQLETLLADTGGGVSNPLFDYLQAISEPLLNSPDVNLQQIALHEKSLQIEVIVKDFAALSQLENALTAKGLTVKQESASLEKDQVLARLQVTQ
ncbi:MAG: type II secretion system protein GspL [Legionellales bacterium]|jgi:general secretion pathway protein L